MTYNGYYVTLSLQSCKLWYTGFIRSGSNTPPLWGVPLGEYLAVSAARKFIEKIIIYEAQTIDHERVQDMDIYLNFIGKFELPPQELTEEEEKELQKLKQRRESQRRYNARVREKRKQTQEEAA